MDWLKRLCNPYFSSSKVGDNTIKLNRNTDELIFYTAEEDFGKDYNQLKGRLFGRSNLETYGNSSFCFEGLDNYVSKVNAGNKLSYLEYIAHGNNENTRVGNEILQNEELVSRLADRVKKGGELNIGACFFAQDPNFQSFLAQKAQEKEITIKATPNLGPDFFDKTTFSPNGTVKASWFAPVSKALLGWFKPEWV